MNEKKDLDNHHLLTKTDLINSFSKGVEIYFNKNK